ncbi:pantetheinase-like [Macrobrachium nipponense]|uniref:pantetheinase-like n=1 Tax=Macrobrachium nipponense TaxID=159736 RepID=UPI0030C7F3BC
MIRAVFIFLAAVEIVFLYINSQDGDVLGTFSYSTGDDKEGTETNTIEYTAAVLDYEAYDDISLGGLALLQENARILLGYAAQAQRQGADIIVFPEHGLTGSNTGTTLEALVSLSQIVPEPEDEVIPCYFTDANDASKVVQELSCGAMELRMYLVVQMTEQQCANGTVKTDFESGFPSTDGVNRPIASAQGEECPKRDLLFFNTQVVFSDTGVVVAKYRKKHLYVESHLSKGEQPDEAAMFTTSFGVTFTLQICFDIMYRDPAISNIETYGLHDAILSTNWIDELPFLTAPQMWKAWSEGNKVNLLASNYFKPSQGALGSGIFRGYTSEPATYVYNAAGGTSLVVGKVTTTPVSSVSTTRSDFRPILSYCQSPVNNYEETGSIQREALDSKESPCESVYSHSNPVESNTFPLLVAEDQTFLHEDLQRYNHSIIEWTSTTNPSNCTKTLCHEDGFCCTVEYDYPRNDTEGGLFMILAYSGLVVKGGGIYPMYSQICSIVFCLNATAMSCARVEGEPVRHSNLRVYELRGNFGNSHVYPSVFTQSLELYSSRNWEFDVQERSGFFDGVIRFRETVKSLLSLTMFSRWYERDPGE